MSKWETTSDGYLKRSLPCSEYKVDETHTVMILRRDKAYDCYIMEHDEHGETPYFFMFGEFIGQQTYRQLVDMVLTVAPDYYYLCDGSTYACGGEC